MHIYVVVVSDEVDVVDKVEDGGQGDKVGDVGTDGEIGNVGINDEDEIVIHVKKLEMVVQEMLRMM